MTGYFESYCLAVVGCFAAGVADAVADAVAAVDVADVADVDAAGPGIVELFDSIALDTAS